MSSKGGVFLGTIFLLASLFPSKSWAEAHGIAGAVRAAVRTFRLDLPPYKTIKDAEVGDHFDKFRDLFWGSYDETLASKKRFSEITKKSGVPKLEGVLTCRGASVGLKKDIEFKVEVKLMGDDQLVITELYSGGKKFILDPLAGTDRTEPSAVGQFGVSKENQTKNGWALSKERKAPWVSFYLSRKPKSKKFGFLYGIDGLGAVWCF